MNCTRLFSTLGTTLILAGLLGPRAFGIVAVALIFVGLLQLVMQQGLISALIQHAGLTRRQLDSAFWILVPLSLTLALLSVLGAHTWADVNGVPEATRVIQVLSVLVVVKSLAVVPEAVLRRQLKFRSLALRTSVANAAGAGVGLAWALVHPSVWALVAQQLVIEGVGCAVIWVASGWRPSPHFAVDGLSSLGGFALKTTLSGLAVFVNNRLDALLIGLYFGPTALGLYRLGGRVVESAVDFTAQPIQQVALPDFSRFQGDRSAMSERYRQTLVVLLVASAPVMAALAAAAGPLMRVLGEDWTSAASALQILCLVGVARAVTILNGPTLQAGGRPGLFAMIAWVAATLSVVALVGTGLALQGQSVDLQVVGMALSRAALFWIAFVPIGHLAVSRCIPDMGGWTYVRTIAPPLGACSAAGLVGIIVADVMLARALPAWVVCITVFTGVLTVALGLSAWWTPEARRIARKILAPASEHISLRRRAA